jgi:hypothetical protein
MNEEKVLLDDNPQISYLIAQKKFPIRYKPLVSDGKVKFLLWGSGLDQAIQQFFANGEIGVQDYLSAFNTVRSIVSALKAGNDK